MRRLLFNAFFIAALPCLLFAEDIDPKNIADGKKWNTAKADGMTMQIVLYPAGDGKFMRGG